MSTINAMQGMSMPPAPAPLPQAALPNVQEVAGMPREDRVSARKTAEFFWDQFQKGLTARRMHAKAWLMVLSILRGIHYFNFSRDGYLRPLKKPDQGSGIVRAIFPEMDPKYRWELGRLNSAKPGVDSIPIAGGGQDRYYKAQRAADLMEFWHEEADVSGFDDVLNQTILVYGMACIYPHIDKMRQSVRLRALSGCEIFPIPYDAQNWEEADGFMHVAFGSKQWLERQDEEMERQGQRPRKLMADKAGQIELGTHDLSPIITGGGRLGGGKSDGAVVLNVWMRPNSQRPAGEWAMLVGEEMYRYQSDLDQQGRSVLFPGGRDPMYPVYYDKHPNDFWGIGLCEKLIAPQREVNRQFSAMIKQALDNKSLLAFDSNLIEIEDIRNETGLVPYTSSGLEANKQPVFRVEGQPITREMTAIFELAQRAAQRAAGHESQIIFGMSEGRVDAGPATSMLNTNANTPIQPVMDRKRRAYRRVYPIVLDMLKGVWPAEKSVKILGRRRVGREIRLSQEGLPWSDEIILEPYPMLAGGSNAQLQMLFSMKQMPADDGKGPEIKSREFRQALQKIGSLPAGVDFTVKAEDRIGARIDMLINDGVQPGVAPAGASPDDLRFNLEDHEMAMDMLKEVILDPGFPYYSPQVQAALKTEMLFHQNAASGVHRMADVFDDGIEALDRRRMEAELDIQEQLGAGQVSDLGALVDMNLM